MRGSRAWGLYINGGKGLKSGLASYGNSAFILLVDKMDIFVFTLKESVVSPEVPTRHPWVVGSPGRPGGTGRCSGHGPSSWNKFQPPPSPSCPPVPHELSWSKVDQGGCQLPGLSVSAGGAGDQWAWGVGTGPPGDLAE